MDIDSLTLEDIGHLIEGFFYFVPKTEDPQRLRNCLLSLIEFHETSDEDLMEGLAYHKGQAPNRPALPSYHSELRRDFIEY
jgi:hypothetical protein